MEPTTSPWLHIIYVRKRSQCLKLKFNWQIPKCDWLVFNLCANISWLRNGFGCSYKQGLACWLRPCIGRWYSKGISSSLEIIVQQCRWISPATDRIPAQVPSVVSCWCKALAVSNPQPLSMILAIVSITWTQTFAACSPALLAWSFLFPEPENKSPAPKPPVN